MITLTDAWMGPPKRRAIPILNLKRRRAGEPMDLANMRANGIRSLAVACLKCGCAAVVNVDVYSITSSARPSSVRGKVRPSAFAGPGSRPAPTEANLQSLG